MLPDGTIITNEMDCPLVERDDLIISRAISIVHECLNGCTFKETKQIQTVERESVKVNKLIFEHDWSNPH